MSLIPPLSPSCPMPLPTSEPPQADRAAMQATEIEIREGRRFMGDLRWGRADRSKRPPPTQ
jgi:hypothetical protein